MMLAQDIIFHLHTLTMIGDSSVPHSSFGCAASGSICLSVFRMVMTTVSDEVIDIVNIYPPIATIKTICNKSAW
jgi:hypothetical protein